MEVNIHSFYSFPDTLDVWGYGYKDNKKINKKETNAFRDIPCNKDIYYAIALVSLNNNVFAYKETNILGAIILK